MMERTGDVRYEMRRGRHFQWAAERKAIATNMDFIAVAYYYISRGHNDTASGSGLLPLLFGFRSANLRMRNRSFFTMVRNQGK